MCDWILVLYQYSVHNAIASQGLVLDGCNQWWHGGREISGHGFLGEASHAPGSALTCHCCHSSRSSLTGGGAYAARRGRPFMGGLHLR